MECIIDQILKSLVTSFFSVIGGALPITLLIYFFARKEGERLKKYASSLEKTLPIQEEILKKMEELVVNRPVNSETIHDVTDNLLKYMEAQKAVEENKKFIKYAKDYNFISAIGNMMRLGRYLPKSIEEHKEILNN